MISMQQSQQMQYWKRFRIYPCQQLQLQRIQRLYHQMQMQMQMLMQMQIQIQMQMQIGANAAPPPST